MKWYHWAGIIAAAAVVLYLFGWKIAAALLAIFTGAEGARKISGDSPVPPRPGVPHPDAPTPQTDGSNASDAVEQQVAEDYVDDMSDEEVFDELEERDF